MGREQKYAIEQTTPPATEAVTFGDVKTYGWVNVTDDDTLITNLIPAVRRQLEEWTGLVLVTSVYKQYLDGWPGEIRLLRGPVSAIGSVAYVDSAQAAQTLAAANYTADLKSRPARISLAYNTTWPELYQQYNAVTITYTCGFGAAADVPYELKHLLWQAALFRYWHRDQSDETWLTNFLSRHWHGWTF